MCVEPGAGIPSIFPQSLLMPFWHYFWSILQHPSPKSQQFRCVRLYGHAQPGRSSLPDQLQAQATPWGKLELEYFRGPLSRHNRAQSLLDAGKWMIARTEADQRQGVSYQPEGPVLEVGEQVAWSEGQQFLHPRRSFFRTLHPITGQLPLQPARAYRAMSPAIATGSLGPRRSDEMVIGV